MDLRAVGDPNLIDGITGVDYGEATFAGWEGTTKDSGTDIGNIKSTLNTHFASWGTWAIAAPSNGDMLLSYIADDVNTSPGQSAVLNVDTEILKFWGGTFARHYDLGDSYDISAATVGVADEWDHANAKGINPFGFHSHISEVEVYDAVHASPTGELVY